MTSSKKREPELALGMLFKPQEETLLHKPERVRRCAGRIWSIIASLVLSCLLLAPQHHAEHRSGALIPNGMRMLKRACVQLQLNFKLVAQLRVATSNIQIQYLYHRCMIKKMSFAVG